MVDISKFRHEVAELQGALARAKRILITAPGAADGDSVGSQLALRVMLRHRYPAAEVAIINDEPLPQRYQCLPEVSTVYTPETYPLARGVEFDIGILVDGGIDRAGRVKEIYDRCPTRVFIDHHVISIDYPYQIRIVDPTASATTELVYHLSQSQAFRTPVDSLFSQCIYIGLIFDTGFFRHSNTTPEVMELAARLMRTGFDFTRLGERGMLERSFQSLRLYSDTLARARLAADGRIVWSDLSQKTLKSFEAIDDDREGIIDQLLLTTGIEVALLFFELSDRTTKISLRSHGQVNVAQFARSLTEHGGGHQKAAGALLEMPIDEAITFVLPRLETLVIKRENGT